MKLAWCTFLGLLGVWGCAAHNPDPFLEAELLAESGAFLGALALLDEVPPAHLRYAESRALAQALERRMRTSQELVLRGMAMRNEWRDQEALRHFQQALQIWPGVAGASGLIRATQNRIHALEQGGRPGQPPEVPTGDDNPDYRQLHTEPVGSEPGAIVPPVPGPEIQGPETDEVRRAAQLRVVQEHLERGDMEDAMDVLEALRLDFPKDPAVTRTFVRVLHQRALLRYGQGFLEGAVEDWKRVLDMQREHRQADAFLKAAETELKLRTPR